MALNFPNSPTDGEQYENYFWDATRGVWRSRPLLGATVQAADTLYYTSNGTFSKADYPWLRAIRVTCVGGGGGSGAAAGSGDGASESGGGGGGGTAQSFIDDIAGLDSTVTVTVGAGGAAGTTINAGQTGGASSFGSLVIGQGGNGGNRDTLRSTGNAQAFGGLGGEGTGDVVFPGSAGFAGTVRSGVASYQNAGGASHFAGGIRPAHTAAATAVTGQVPGGGASGARNNATGTQNGAAGGDGLVMVELFA